VAENQDDSNLNFLQLSAAAGLEAGEPVRNLFIGPLAYDIWAVSWRERNSLAQLLGVH
jgi:hypothetical protein